MKYIEEVMKNLREGGGLELDKEEDIAGFLGVAIDQREDGTISMTQSGLANKVVDALLIKKLPRKFTPAETTPLVKDEKGELPDLQYNYASIVGMFQYLQWHYPPDITYAVVQVARYTHAPKRLHKLALERIGKYLKSTLEEGLIFKPNEVFRVDCYVNADFAYL